MDFFLAIAEELKLKGLKGSDDLHKIESPTEVAQIKQKYNKHQNVPLNTTAEIIPTNEKSRNDPTQALKSTHWPCQHRH